MAPRGLPPSPLVYEINTWPWLDRVGAEAGRRVDLATVPPRHWDAIAASGFDAVWLMGVWARSPAGIQVALADADLVATFRAALPDLTAADVVGSPYCVRDYSVDPHLGGPGGLAVARAELAERGVGLVLDFVPNHVAPDHPWTREHPEYFVAGTAEDLQADPTSFSTVDGRILANGRDPYFPAWRDVVQLNAFSPDLRAAVVATMLDIAAQCDGVRCDMAMLMLNDIFEVTWGDRAGPRPDGDYWTTVIPAVRDRYAGFRFIAEAYWDLEWALQQQGFDHCYDKRLYDRLLQDSAKEVHGHLQADDAYQARLLRFVENHDEPRAAAVLEPARQRAVTVTTLTQCGARLFHHGQAEGWKVRLPVFLGRFPDEATDEELATFHRTLLAALADPTFRHGRWRLCECSGWEGDDRAADLVAWCWEGTSRWLVVVNLGGREAAGQVRAPWDDLRGRTVRLVDPTAGVTYERAGDDLTDGLYVGLDGWSWHLWRIEDGTATR